MYKTTNTNDTFLSRDYTNCLRGISMMIIVIFHMFIQWDISRIFNLAGHLGVAVFLFLSGYGLNESFKKNGLKKYWIKKIRRVIIPYILFYCVLTIIRGNADIKTFILGVTLIDTDFWFISCLVKWYLVFWIAKKMFPKHSISILVLVGIVCLNVASQFEAQQSFSFIAGVIVSTYKTFFAKLNNRQLIKYAVIGFIFGFFFLMLKEIPAIHAYKGTLPYHYILLCIMLPMSISIIVFPHFFPKVIKSEYLHICGLASMEIYLVHLSILNLVDDNLLHVIIFTITTVILSFIFYMFNTRILKAIIR